MRGVEFVAALVGVPALVVFTDHARRRACVRRLIVVRARRPTPDEVHAGLNEIGDQADRVWA